MTSPTETFRLELDKTFRPPIDVMLDPSLLVAKRTLTKLPDSSLLESQTQTTLTGGHTTPRIGEVHVSNEFIELLDKYDQVGLSKTDVWDFFRGTADPAYLENISEFLDETITNKFSTGKSQTKLNLGSVSGIDPGVSRIIQEQFDFISQGGVLVSRTPSSVNEMRDAGTLTFDIGHAKAEESVGKILNDLTSDSGVTDVTFGVTDVDAVIDAIASNVLSHPLDALLYRFES